ncbi:uncharacterized protein LOC124945943 [Impatiens glandulifera]|uniref:uncharacterized protein LOC124945943 n=1 Tax=Impatiens glandulifera TaxID=253017 RepID=UPI001FB18C5A|nr:uncharacterized protein LOC124945943 [Impatiens glandulifera]
MEKPQQLKSLSPQDWETLFDDFQFGGARRERWVSSNYNGFSLLELALSSILRKDFPINGKLHIIVFLEEYSYLLFCQEDSSDLQSSISDQVLTRFVESLIVIIQAPIDGVSVTYALKEQMMISTTSILITLKEDDEFLDSNNLRQLESLTELLLTVINRPNHGPDRQIRAAACECLRQLERAHPCLLSEISGRLWGLCQSERTHSAQSYILLLTTVIHCILIYKPNVSILNSSITLVPFNVPQFLTSGGRGFSSEISNSTHKELRRVMSFLLEWPQFLTSCGVMEFMSMIVPMTSALDLQVSLLKVQFWGLLHTYDPLLWHTYLTLFSHFLVAFDGQESEIASRLVSISRESQHLLAFRLLSLEWLIGFIVLLKEEGKRKAIMKKMSLNFYPAVYDPLALKLMKLDLISYSFILFHDYKSKDTEASSSPDRVNSDASVVKLFKDGFISVSSLKWLPAWSSETAVAFRYFHKFLIGSSSHSDVDPFPSKNLTESTIFCNLQKNLVALALESKGLVPVIVALITRLTVCHKHHLLGNHMLQTLDRDLLPKLRVDYQLTSYFPIFNEIAKNVTISPCGLINVLTRFVIFLIEKHGPETGLRSWSNGSQVLDICRTMLVHHTGSRIFLSLYRLLAFTCLCFPDLEVRDDARIYLRMLVCIPGKKLKLLLNNGVQHTGIASSTQSGSYFNVHSPRVAHDPKKSRTLSSYVYIDRTIPLLVTQLWSLSLPSFGTMSETQSLFEGIKVIELPVDQLEHDGTSNEIIALPLEIKTIDYPGPGIPLRVMDSKISGIIETLRQHFSSIPDFKHDRGLKVTIPCTLKFTSEHFNRIWGINDVEEEPAMYAIVVAFSSSAPYGVIPSCHIPFLTGLPVENDNYTFEVRRTKGEPITIELEPREPVPGLIDVSLEANTENGEIIRGRLENITVGMEDMFLQATVPADLPNEGSVSEYYLELFTALWEACGSSSNTGRETFPLKGGKVVVAINGTESVKLMVVSAISLVRAVENHLARFVVSVSGEFLIGMVKGCGNLSDIFWEDVCSSSGGYELESVKGPLFLKYTGLEEDEEEEEMGKYALVSKKDPGLMKIMIFLPPRYHLLLQIEVGERSSLVRIRTDHWPCLAYIDDYLEALFSS